jgi:hypothetical protein
MRRAVLTAPTIVLLLGLLISASCIGISATDLQLTQIAVVRPTVAHETQLTATVEIQTAVAATLTSVPIMPPPIEVAFKSSHGRYITALGEADGWALRQEAELSDCGWFTQHHLANGKIALETCHGRYITAPQTGAQRLDWMLGQTSELSGCGQFDLYDLGDDRVAFKTCAGNFSTAGDGDWPPPLQWSVVAETDVLLDWEIFTVLLRP